MDVETKREWLLLDEQLKQSKLTCSIYSWLSTKGSLTARIRDMTGLPFEVKLMNESWSSDILQRQVSLGWGQLRHLYAESLIPRPTLNKLGSHFDSLGENSLGDYLFKLPMLTRGPIEVSFKAWPEFSIQTAVWARRSDFFIQGRYALHVQEIFLPTFWEALNDSQA